MADIPLWPWNRNLHRCLDCGYLSRHWTDNPSNANGQGAAPADLLPRCYRSVYDLSGEAEEIVVYPPRPAGTRDEWPSEVASGWEEASRRAELEAVETTMRATRSCSLFIQFEPGLSFEAHRELQLRRRDRQWTLAAGMTGALIGSGLTLLGALAVLLLA